MFTRPTILGRRMAFLISIGLLSVSIFFCAILLANKEVERVKAECD